MRLPLVLLLLVLLGSSLEAQRARRGPALDRRPLKNFLVVVVDDIGVEKLAAYGEAPAGVPVPCTPNIDRLAAEGLLFRNAWSNPMCSPSRAQLLTGRHGFRTGVGDAIPSVLDYGGLSEDELLLPAILPRHTSAVLGKWHVANFTMGFDHALRLGFDEFRGSMWNLLRPPVDPATCTTGPPFDFFNWVRIDDRDGDGVLEEACTSKYATVDTTDDALDFLQRVDGPWLAYVSYHSAHTPIQEPPADLAPASPTMGCPSSAYASSATDSVTVTNRMIEALDSELGRLLDFVRREHPNTVVFFTSDNGTASASTPITGADCFSANKVKGSLFEGGINVPMIIAGVGVVPGECSGLVSLTDLYATIAELAFAVSTTPDSVSMVPYLRGHQESLRRTVYAERFFPNQPRPDNPRTDPFQPDWHVRTVRGERFKLARTTDEAGVSREYLFDLVLDPCETVNLCPSIFLCDPASLPLEAVQAYLELRDELIALGVY